MGLASFNRMRRERAKAETLEAERFKQDNALRNDSRNARVDMHRRNKRRLRAIREEDAAANRRIGEKVIAGAESRIPDEQLRKDHAAEIAGRNLEGVQTPKDPVARVAERIPQGETANEKLVGHTSVGLPGPDADAVAAAAREVGARRPADTRAERREARREDRTEPRPRENEAAESNAVERDSVDIPQNWQDLPWPQRRSLAAKVSADPVNTAEEVDAAIATEVKRRGR